MSSIKTLIRSVFIAGLAAASLTAQAVDPRDRAFISRGTPEGEVVFKIGKPDHEAFVNNIKGQPEVKTWTYFPHPRDPQTMTIVTLRAGVVESIDRKIAR